MTQSWSGRSGGSLVLRMMLLRLVLRVSANPYLSDWGPRALTYHSSMSFAEYQEGSDAFRKSFMASGTTHSLSPNEVSTAKALHKAAYTVQPSKSEDHGIPQPTSRASQTAGRSAKEKFLPQQTRGSPSNGFLSAATSDVEDKSQTSPRWAQPRWKRTMPDKVHSSPVVGARSQIVMKKLEGGRPSDSRTHKLDQAFISKLLQGRGAGASQFAVHRARGKHRGVHNVTVSKAATFTVQCDVDMRVTMQMEKDLRCPAKCPLMVKDAFDSTFCEFKCVANTVSNCRSSNPETTVPDLKNGVCRACDIQGCSRCVHDGTDTCAECASGYQLSAGKCHSQFVWVKYACCGILGLLVLFVIAWVVTLQGRPITNPATLLHALAVRSRIKLHRPIHLTNDERAVEGTPTADGQPRKLWPMSTNLCTTNVVGPGVTLSFNFQMALIIWAIILALAWLAIGVSIDYPTLFILGTMRAKTEWENCWIVRWGFNTQQRLMWTKVAYLIFVYFFTFLGAIIFAVCQLRRFESMDRMFSTHKDFCAKISGLPHLIGSVHVEEEIRRAMASISGQRVIGVSVCWDMGDKEDLLMQIIESDLDKRDTDLHGQSLPCANSHHSGLANRLFSAIESVFLSSTFQKILTKRSRHKALPNRHSRQATKPDPKDEETGHVMVVDPVHELHKLETTSQAFVVFETEGARDAAVESMRNGIEFRGVTLKIEEASCEPGALMWANMHNESLKDKARDITLGIFKILLVLFVWTAVFFLPYLWVALGGSGGNYANGQEPDVLTSFTLGMIVVAGNALMHVVSGEVADRTHFQHVESRELCYMAMYLFGCVCNVLLSMICAYYIAFYAMVGVGMKTYDGTPLVDMKGFTERFETYAMQQEMGRTLLNYAMPFTTLVPFLAEPLLTIYIPYKLMLLIVRTKPDIQGVTAEAYLKPLVMDTSRYADLLLNVMLAVGILFFPGGFNLIMFIGLALSHIYIYSLDHYCVLRASAACDFGSRTIDWWAQWILCIPCGVILVCFVYKLNCEGHVGDIESRLIYGEGARFKIGGHSIPLVLACLLAFIGHIMFHTVVLVFVVPCFGHRQKELRDEHYEHCARRSPISWFSGNPVHCLRSQFIYDHSPSCDYSMLGKQHLVRVNHSIGCYFSEQGAESEDYSHHTEPHFDDLHQLSSRKAVDAVASLSSRRNKQSTASKYEQYGSKDR